MPADGIDAVMQPKTGWFSRLSPPWPLSWHLGALVASVALPALFLGAYLLNQQHRAELDVIERDATARAEAMSYATDAAVMGIISTLKAIGANPALEGKDFSSIIDQSQASFSNTDIVVTLWDANIKPVKSTQESKVRSDLLDGDEAFARNALDSRNPQISDFSFGRGSADHVVHVWVPVEIGLKRQYLLEAMIPTKFFNATLLHHQLPFGWSAGISDRRDRIIARTDDYERFVGQLISEDTRRNTIGPAGIMRSVDLIGRPTMQAYLHSDLTGWRMSTWAPRSLIEARAQENWTNFMLMGGTLAAFAALSAWIWASRMTASVTELAESAQRLASDNLLDDVETPVLEVRDLRNTISTAAAELIRRKHALGQNVERLSLALDAGGMGVWEWEPDTDATLWDDGIFRMTGFDSSVTPASGKAFIERIHKDDIGRVQAAMAETMANNKPTNVDFRFLRPDGVQRWFAIRGSNFPERNGMRSRLMGVNFDITDEKDAAARTHALLREVSHRTKNLLAIILAISRVTARDATTVQGYERSLSSRIAGLAASQDLIVASDWQSVELHALISSQLKAVLHETSDRIELAGPKLILNPTAAQNLGMAITELVLNAIEHGALSNDIGRVDVSWKIVTAEAVNEILIEWSERNGPLVAGVQKRGYGLAVIERLVIQSLKAKTDIKFAADGIRWSILAPVETLVLPNTETDNGTAENPDAPRQL